MSDSYDLMELSSQLLPCPFCGGEAHLAWYRGGKHGTAKERRALKGKTEVVAECFCGLAIWGATTPQEAINRWNRRAEDTGLKPCPFCGSPAKIVRGIPMWVGDYELYFARCTNQRCGAEMTGDGVSDKEIALWNERVSQKGETD